MAEKIDLSNDPSIYDDRGAIGSSEELDEYGVWVKSEPEDILSAFSEVDELSDFDGLMENIEELSETGDIPALDSLNLEEVGFSGAEEDAFTGISIDGGDAGPENAIIREMNFDDLALPSAPPSSGQAAGGGGLLSEPAVSGKTGGDLSTQLLMRIAEELSSIRGELTILKTELSSVKAQRQTGSQEEPAGFFGEEDDKKIALTGDELNNILSTANLTEEAASVEEAVPEEDVVFAEQAVSTQEAVAPESSGFDTDPGLSDEISPIEEIFQDELAAGAMDEADTALLDLAAEAPAADGLDSLREEGVSPMIKLEEDTSYLEVDSLAQIDEIPQEAAPLTQINEIPQDDELSIQMDEIPQDDELSIQMDKIPGDDESLIQMDEISGDDKSLIQVDEVSEDNDALIQMDEIPQEFDLSNAVIDEPDLSADIIENPLEDPLVNDIDDISIDLDMEDTALLEENGPAVQEETAAEEPEFNIDDLPPLDEESSNEGEYIEIDNSLLGDFNLDVPADIGGAAPPGEELSLESLDFENLNLEDVNLEDLNLEITNTAEETAVPEEIIDMPEEPAEAGTLEEIGTLEGADALEEVETLETVDTPADAGLSFLESAETGLGDAGPEEQGIPIPEEFVPEELLAENAEAASAPPEIKLPESGGEGAGTIPSNLKQELKTVLSYMDQLLESLPEDKIEEFAKSEYFDTYKKLFEELGLI